MVAREARAVERQRACRRISLVFFRSPFPFTASSSSLANKNDKAHEQPCSPTLIKRERDSAQPESAAQGRERERERRRTPLRARARRRRHRRALNAARRRHPASSPSHTQTARFVSSSAPLHTHLHLARTRRRHTQPTNDTLPARASRESEHSERRSCKRTSRPPACVSLAEPPQIARSTPGLARAHAPQGPAPRVCLRARARTPERGTPTLSKNQPLSPAFSSPLAHGRRRHGGRPALLATGAAARGDGDDGADGCVLMTSCATRDDLHDTTVSLALAFAPS